MFRFRFNAAARKEAISALRKLANIATPLLVVLASFVLPDANEKLIAGATAVITFIVCNALVVYIAGLEENSSKSEKPAKTDDSS